MKVSLAACLLVMVSGSVAAMETRLVCENPRREYLVVYSTGASELILNPDSNPTRYRVLVDDMGDRLHVVTAAPSNDGPTVRLHLRPYQKMEFWSGGAIVQTDGCYGAK